MAQVGGRFENNHNYAQQQPLGQHSPNAQRQTKPQGIMKQPNQPAEKRTMLRFQYFLNLLSDPDVKPQQKTVAAFVLAQLTSNNFKLAQKELTAKGYLAHCNDLLCDDDASSVKLLKLWLLIGLGRLWSDYDQARWTGIRLNAPDKVLMELTDDSAEVRAAAVFALGSLLKNSSRANEHASAVEESTVGELCTNCAFDSSVLVREELIVSLQWFVLDFEKRFVKQMLDLSSHCKFELPSPKDPMTEEENEQGYDVAAMMPSNKGPHTPPIKEFMQPSMNRKKMSTSMFLTAVEETVYEDPTGNVYTFGKNAEYVERGSEVIKFRERAMAQIRYLEAKTFNDAVEKTWLTILRLSLDPVERVARMAQKIVRQVELGIPAMQANIDNTMAHLNKKMIARKTSRATVEMPSRPVGPSAEAAGLSEQIHKNLKEEKVPESGVSATGIDFTELKRIQDEKMSRRNPQVKNLRDSEKVKFQVGSPDLGQHNNNSNVLSPGSSLTDSSELFSNNEESEGDYREDDDLSATGRDQETIASGKTVRGGPFRKTELMEMAMKEFTPKRANKIGAANFTKGSESKSLRNFIENPLVTTQFVPWCSKVFVEPILHVITLDDVKTEHVDHDDEDEFMPERFREKIKEIHAADVKKDEQKRKQDERDGRKHKTQEEFVLTTTTISDWAIHAMEGMVQSAEIEGRDFKSSRYDHCLWQVKLDHPAKCIATSKLRRCMYATDGLKMTIIRQDMDTRHFRKFNLTDGNPFVEDRASQLILINEVSREMIIACSPNGYIRIWDPYFLGWCDDYEKPPELVSACSALGDEMRLGDTANRCLFDWNQPNGKLLCTGTRSVRIWDAHAEKVCQDLQYSSARKITLLPTAMSGNLDDEGNLVCLGYSDGRVDYFDMRMKTKAARVHLSLPMGNQFGDTNPGIMYLKVNRRGLDTEMFAGNKDGCIYRLQLRMFKEATPSIVAPWRAGEHHCMTVHDDSRILASSSGSELLIYDVAQNKQMASISPPVEPDPIRREKSATGFGIFGVSQRKLSTATISSSRSLEKEQHTRPRIISLTMHQMRFYGPIQVHFRFFGSELGIPSEVGIPTEIGTKIFNFGIPAEIRK
uniref:WD_REPEATS_REGION domain-containing protein n=1 Tax=Caenorhabditis japonica TaxID=281687 RepID=A0A8R1DSE8_CAEJA